MRKNAMKQESETKLPIDPFAALSPSFFTVSVTPECFTTQWFGSNRFTGQYLFLKLPSMSKSGINYEAYNLL